MAADDSKESLESLRKANDQLSQKKELPLYSQRIRKFREAKGWSQEDLGSRVGADQKSVSRWELGKKKPTHKNRQGLIKVFETTAEDLGLVDEEPAVTSFDTRETGHPKPNSPTGLSDLASVSDKPEQV